jgi:drug/metabolite transporter (DMT)-like permease
VNRYYIQFLIAVLLFGSNGIIASHIALDSYVIVLSRLVIGSIFLVGVLLVRNKGFLAGQSRQTLLYLLLAGLALGGNWLFLYEAYTQIGVSLATLTCYCGPVIVMLLSVPLFHERITLIKVAGMVAVILGMIFVNGVDVQHHGLSWGLVSGILSALCFAALVIVNKKVQGVDGLESTLCQLIIGAIMVSVVTWNMHPVVAALSGESIVAILILGILNTGIGCYFYFSSIQHLPAQTVSICGYMEPFSALVFAAIFLGEVLTLMQIVGAVLLLGGIVFSELYPALRRQGEIV